LRDWAYEQALNPYTRIVHLLLRKARVDDVYNPINRQRRLRNVRRHHDLAPWNTLRGARPRRRIKDPLLLLRRERRVQRDAHERPYGVRVLVGEVVPLQLDLAACVLDLLFARE